MSTNKQENDFCGVTQFHDDGFRGEGIVIMNVSVEKDHDECCEQRILEAAPNAIVLTASLGGEGDNNSYQGYTVYKGKRYKTEDFIREFNVKFITKSSIGPDGAFVFKEGPKKEYYKWLKKECNIIIVAAAGNGCSAYNFNNPQESDEAILVGSCKLRTKPTIIVDAGDVSPNDDTDFTEFNGNDGQSGTSFAAPYFAGKCALVCQKYGMDITQEQIYQIMIDCSTGNGKWINNKLGYGEPRIQNITNIEPKPGTLDPEENYTLKVEFPIDMPYMVVNGEKVTIDCPATIDKNTSRTLVPIRAAAEALGCKVEWDNIDRKVVLYRD